MKQASNHLLLCDDDQSLSVVIADFLRTKGYKVDRVSDGDSALDKLGSSYYDLCLLNLNMPKKDGLEILAELKMMEKLLPVIVITDSSNLELILSAYEKGCDDYMIKPLSIELLVYKIEAILRRSRIGFTAREVDYVIGKKHFNSANQTIDGQHMSTRESDLLQLLCQNKNNVVDRHLILRTLWNNDSFFAARSLAVYINHLRKFLAGSGAIIQGVHGRGYKIIY